MVLGQGLGHRPSLWLYESEDTSKVRKLERLLHAYFVGKDTSRFE